MVEKKATKAKSTPKKRAVEVEESKPESEVRQAEPVQPQINWDVIGFSSAAVTLLGSALIFMLGWSYESNWYGYFGINTEQINIPIQQILIYSTPALSTTVYGLLTSTAVYFIFTRLYTREGFKMGSVPPFLVKDWILIIWLANFMFLLLGITTIQSTYENTTFNIEYYPYEGRYLNIIIYGLVSMLIIISGMFISYLFHKLILRRDISSPLSMFSVVFGFKGIVWLTLTVFISFWSLLLVSASYAYKDASMARKGVQGDIQPVFIIIPRQIESLQELEQSCDKFSTCTYGPFGLAAETENAYYLIKWENPKQTRIKKNPGLYILPRYDQNGSYIIIPASSTSTVSTTQKETPTYTPQPTQAVLVTPKPINAMTPTPNQP